MPTAFQGSTCVRGELKRRNYQVKARYQVKANALLTYLLDHVFDALVIQGLLQLRSWLQDTSNRKLANFLFFFALPPPCFPEFTRG